MNDVIIIGGGVAGLSAALYASRARLKTLMLERGVPGGQLATTEEVENYPGFLHITGPELMAKMEEQAKHFGTEIMMGVEITSMDLTGDIKKIVTPDGVHEGRTVILAMGAEYRPLGVPGEDRLRAKGVSYCATCDAAFFRDRKVAVIGGGSTAVEEGTFLTKFASDVTLIHRRDKLRAEKILQERAFANPKMGFMWDTVVESIEGDKSVESITLRNINTGETHTEAVDGVFIFVGMDPNTALVKGQVTMDDGNYILTDDWMATNLKGVYAAGDVRKTVLRQAVTSASDGAIAAVAAEKYLETLHG
ncbi:MAG: thioredoxin-disulfide reductase [Candidatus Sericytochromatia bacterium]|nr:thioredoxin-disulfide reductase [Candidatus Sericytochromatia bacterium]